MTAIAVMKHKGPILLKLLVLLPFGSSCVSKEYQSKRLRHFSLLCDGQELAAPSFPFFVVEILEVQPL